LHKAFWKLTMMDHPDLIVLKVRIVLRSRERGRCPFMLCSTIVEI
jgi:hypothetical protein